MVESSLILNELTRCQIGRVAESIRIICLEGIQEKNPCEDIETGAPKNRYKHRKIVINAWPNMGQLLYVCHVQNVAMKEKNGKGKDVFVRPLYRACFTVD